VGLLRQVISSLQGSTRIDQELSELYDLQKRNGELKMKLKEVQGLEFMERVARDGLGLSRSGETVFVISQEMINEIVKGWEEKKEVKLPNWQGWLKLFWK